MSTTTLPTPDPSPPTAPAQSSASSRDEAFTATYRAYWPFVFRYVRKQLPAQYRDLDTVRNLTQDVFMNTWKAMDRAPLHDRDRLHPWLATVAARLVSAQFSPTKKPGANRATEHLMGTDEPFWTSNAASSPDATNAISQVAGRVDLSAALETLPPDTRQIVRLRFLDDLPSEEIAERLGCPATRIKRHTANGLAALREQLDATPARDTDPAGSLVRQVRDWAAARDGQPVNVTEVATAFGCSTYQARVALSAGAITDHAEDTRTTTRRPETDATGATPGREEQRWHHHTGPCSLGLSLSEQVRRLDTPHPAPQARPDQAGRERPLTEYADTVWTAAMDGIDRGTRSKYGVEWRRLVAPALGATALHSLDSATVEKAVRDWVQHAPKAVNRYTARAALTRVLDQAVRDGHLPHNPLTGPGLAERATTLPTPPAAPTAPEHDQQERHAAEDAIRTIPAQRRAEAHPPVEPAPTRPATGARGRASSGTGGRDTGEERASGGDAAEDTGPAASVAVEHTTTDAVAAPNAEARVEAALIRTTRAVQRARATVRAAEAERAAEQERQRTLPASAPALDTARDSEVVL